MQFFELIGEINRLLLNSPDPQVGLERSLELISKEYSIDYLLIDKNVLNEETNRIYVENIYEKRRTIEIPEFDRDLLSNFSYEDVYEVFSTTLAVGRPLYRNKASEVQKSNKLGEFLLERGVKSLCVTPIFFNSNHWGNLSFLDFTEEREWGNYINEVQIIASSLAAFFKNTELRELFGHEICSSHSAKMATLGEMASGIAHEINNPLFVINGFASKIDSSIERGILDVNELKNISTIIQRNCKRVTSIISGLRLLSRKSKLDDLEVKCLKEIISTTVDISRERFRLSEIKLIDNIDYKVESLIECLPEQISQVLVNLLNNAYDSLCSIEKSDKWISLDFVELEDRVVFSLTDCGDIVDSSVAKNIMQPFYTTKESGKGTGLGLSISKEIISKHGGKFYLDEHCENMRFVIELPKISFE